MMKKDSIILFTTAKNPILNFKNGEYYMITVYTLNQQEQWDSVVRTFADYDIYWLSGYAKSFQIHGDGEPLLFYYEGENTRGINVVMKRDIECDPHFTGKIPPETFFDFSTPYGYGGWIIEGDDSTVLFAEYEKWCRDNNIVSEFVRFHPAIKNYKYVLNSYYDTSKLGDTVLLDLSTREVIWENITSKNRNMIRKAQKNGIKIYKGNYPEIYDKFMEIYNQTMKKDNAKQYYYFGKDFYNSILEDVSDNAQVFYAVYNNIIIAASIMLVANGRMNYHLSGSVKEYSSLAPSNLLLYEAAIWGCENGCKTLHLGGGVGSTEDSLFKFKKSFYRKDDVTGFYIGKKVFMQDKYDELVDMRECVGDSFFPAYRS